MNGETQQTTPQATAPKAKRNVGKIIGTTVVVAIVSLILGYLTCGWLFNWVYTDLEPMNVWKTQDQINFGLSAVGDLILAFILVWVYGLIAKGIPGQGVKKGMNYGLLVWLLSLGGMWATLMFMTVNPGVVLYLTISGLVIFLIKGAIIGAMVKN